MFGRWKKAKPEARRLKEEATIKEIVIEGNNFYDIEGFYWEIDRVLTKDLSWQTGHNLNAFNDLLWGGFGVHEYEEPIVLIWRDSEKSKADLGYGKTARCSEGSTQSTGDTLFDMILGIIRDHEHIKLVLE